MTIRAIYFDLGGVILRTEDKGPRTTLAASFGITYEAIEKIVHGGGPQGSAARASIGLLTEEQHWLNVVQALNLPESEVTRVENAYFAGDRLDWALINFIRSLRPSIQVGLISNAWSGLRTWMMEQKFDDAFNHLTISAEVGMGKPDERIYLYALEQFNIRPEEAIFVDDMPANIEAANVLGMHGIHFKTTEQTIAELKKLLTH
jgi:HAD superfamily hydrolase (TIGR01509 family)